MVNNSGTVVKPLFVLILLLASPCFAATFDVQVSNNFFSPATVTILQGDTVRWSWVAGSHTVTSGSGAAAPGSGILFDAPSTSSNTIFSFRFNTPGTFLYFCRPHEFIGMTGTVIVDPVPVTLPDADGDGLPDAEEAGQGTDDLVADAALFATLDFPSPNAWLQTSPITLSGRISSAFIDVLIISTDGGITFETIATVSGLTWSFSWVPGVSGAHSIVVKAFNVFGGVTQTDPITVNFLPDFPIAVITSPVSGTHLRESVAITGSASEGAVGGIEQYLLEYLSGTDATVITGWQQIASSSTQVVDGQLGTWDVSGLADGDYVLRLTVSDVARISQTHVLVTVNNSDIQPPDAPILSITGDVLADVVRDSSVVSIEGNAEAGSTVSQATINGQDVTDLITIHLNGSIRGSFTLDAIGAETIALEMTVQDAIGNVSTIGTSNALTVDNDEPIVSIEFPPDGAAIGFSPLTINGTAADVGAAGLLKVEVDDGGTPTEAAGMDSWTWEWAPSQVGSFTITAKATDVLGNDPPDSISVSYDPDSPTAYITSPAAGQVLGEQLVNIVGRATDSADFQSYLLRYGEGESPDSWNVIENLTTPVTDDVLGVWDTTGLRPFGTLTLQLLVLDGTGQSEFRVTIINDVDTDDDGIRDLLDEDDDGDGYSDELEAAHGTDPLSSANVPTEFFVDGSVVHIVSGFGTQEMPWTTIQFALDTAQGSEVNPADILVSQGTYNEAITMHEFEHLFGGYENVSWTRDFEANVTTMDGSTARSGEPAFHVVIGANNATLNGFTVTGGNANDSIGSGGGMFNSSSSPSVINCTFSNNSANDDGGGMYNWDNSSPTLTNCTFSNNSAGSGGGMHNSGFSSPMLTNCTFSNNSAEFGAGMANSGRTSATVTNCTFSNNTASVSGGGMSNLDSSPTLTNCTFSNNSAVFGGGGMYNLGFLSPYSSSPTLTNCTFSKNSAEFVGGGVYNVTSSPTITNCTFSSNSAEIGWMYSTFDWAGSGGGMYNTDQSSPTLTNCTFSKNSAEFGGGGMYNVISSPTLTNCTFSANSAEIGGGGMYNRSLLAVSFSSPTLTNCTFSNNSAATGGGIYNTDDSSPTLTNCILWGDLPDEVQNFSASHPIVTYSNVQGGYPGEGNIDVRPFFVDAANGDLGLRGHSPAIDAGTSEGAPSVDIDGDARPIGDAVDIGADEYNPVTSDSDGDGTPDAVDTDDDNDGVPDAVDLGPFDTPPEIIPRVTDIITQEDRVLSKDLTPHEADFEDSGAALVWSISDTDPALIETEILLESDVLTITPIPDANGVVEVTLTLMDSIGQIYNQTTLITVTSVNDPPVLSTMEDIVFDEDTISTGLDLDDFVEDVDHPDDLLTWTHSGSSNITAVIDTGTHELTLSAPQDWNGTEAITFRVEDPDGLSAETTVSVNVLPVNDPPFISPEIPDFVVLANFAATIDLYRFENDVDNEAGELVWSVANVDTALFDATVDVESKELTIVPVQDAEGSDLIELVLSDGQGVESQASQEVLITVSADTDNDGMPDVWEIDHGLNPDEDDSLDDADGDGLSNLDEFKLGTSPINADTDEDGQPDGWEFLNGLDPLIDDSGLDFDADGLTNLEEFLVGSDPNDGSDPPSEVFVASDGSDEAGNGSSESPWATIGMAMDTVTPFATAAHPVTITVGAGTYAEEVIFSANVSLIGAGAEDTTIQFFDATQDQHFVMTAADNTVVSGFTITLPGVFADVVVLLSIEDVSMDVGEVILDGGFNPFSIGVLISGVNSSDSSVHDSVVKRLNDGIWAVNSAVSVARNLFEDIRNDAVFVLPPEEKGEKQTDADTPVLGDTSQVETAGINRFRNVSGFLVRNASPTEVAAQFNDWGVYTSEEIAQALSAEVNFEPFISSEIPSGSVVIQLLDAATGEEVPDSTSPSVSIAELNLAAFRDEVSGLFILESVDSGTWTVSADAIGFATQETTFEATGTELVTFTISLIPILGEEGVGETVDGEGEGTSERETDSEGEGSATEGSSEGGAITISCTPLSGAPGSANVPADLLILLLAAAILRAKRTREYSPRIDA